MFHDATSVTKMSGERGPKKHCTRLPSQRSACCCSTSLMGDSETLQQTQNTAQQPAFATQMNNQNRWSSHRKETTKKKKRKREAHASLPPAVEDGAIPAPSSVRLHASFNAAVGLVMCASHSACRTEILLSICRALLKS